MRVGKDLLRQCEEAKAKARGVETMRLQLSDAHMELDELKDTVAR